ncbi:Hypothetical protein NCS54_00635200 [Fusarium falciforme]|uniref:Hypothetical protein n=1 Tax=Fusarium falciforme TaxID=195108 RepID=UPI002300CAD7|nr:Hypothetical protein NCS54_00635200 [Fusarium falciforme]WAO88980.1 Hypothetical protein NCS54_00635200 [Fusarium falciforme]
MATVSRMIDLVWQPPRKKPGVKRPMLDRRLPENFKHYGNWGFTIYRTYYSPESDKHWDILLDALKRQTCLALGYYEDGNQYRHDVKQRGSRFYSGEEEYMSDLNRLKELFRLDPREDPLLLDGLDVRRLREDIFVVKAVAYRWEEAYDARWGWTRMPTGYLLELWHSLMLSADNPYWSLQFKGPEEDLEHYLWDGDSAAEPTATCSDVQPYPYHYEIPEPLFKFEKKQLLPEECDQ